MPHLLDQSSVVGYLTPSSSMRLSYYIEAEDLRGLHFTKAGTLQSFPNETTETFDLNGTLDRHCSDGSAAISGFLKPFLNEESTEARAGAIVDDHPSTATQPAQPLINRILAAQSPRANLFNLGPSIPLRQLSALTYVFLPQDEDYLINKRTLLENID